MPEKLFGVPAEEQSGKLFGVAADEGPAQEKPWFGEPRPQNEGLLSSLFHAPAYGVQDIGTGVQHVMEPGKRLQGAHEIISGVGRAAIPFIAPAAAVTGVGPMALGLAGSAVGSKVGSLGARALGANEDVANIAGDVGALAGGISAPRIPFKAMGGKALDIMPETDPAMRAAAGVFSPRLRNILDVVQKAKTAREAYQGSTNPVVSGDPEGFSKLPQSVQDAVLRGQSTIPRGPSAPAPAPPRSMEHYGVTPATEAPVAPAPTISAPDLSKTLSSLKQKVGIPEGQHFGETPGAHYPERWGGSDSPTIRSTMAKSKYIRVNPEELGVHGGVEGTPIRGPLNTPEKIRIAKELAAELKKNAKGGK